jgi:hypothetical protein
MTRSRQETCEWYDDARSLQAPRASARALTGVPESWQNFRWWIAGLTFSSLWLSHSWSVAAPATRDMPQSLWTLLLSLAICYGIYKFSKPQSKLLARSLCVVSAIVLLLQHATRT